jgi:GGDEF domain-containing protein
MGRGNARQYAALAATYSRPSRVRVAGALTELANRNRLMTDPDSKETLTVVLVNIDRFKEINDYFG